MEETLSWQAQLAKSNINITGIQYNCSALHMLWQSAQIQHVDNRPSLRPGRPRKSVLACADYMVRQVSKTGWMNMSEHFELYHTLIAVQQPTRLNLLCQILLKKPVIMRG